MGDDSTRKLFDIVDKLTIEVTEIKVMLAKIVMEHQEKTDARLDRHRRDIIVLERRVQKIEEDKRLVISIKKLIVGSIGLAAVSAGMAASIVNVMR